MMTTAKETRVARTAREKEKEGEYDVVCEPKTTLSACLESKKMPAYNDHATTVAAQWRTAIAKIRVDIVDCARRVTISWPTNVTAPRAAATIMVTCVSSPASATSSDRPWQASVRISSPGTVRPARPANRRSGDRGGTELLSWTRWATR